MGIENEPRRIAWLSWPRLREMIEGGESLCLLPVGATEQHGRHLPAGTDTMIVEAICAAVSAHTGVPMLPPLAVSSSHAHTTAWPGTLSLPPRLLIEVVIELGRWARASGFDRMLIVNGHVGNWASLGVAVEELRARSVIRPGLVHWFSLTPAIASAITADAEDWHANAAETSVMLHLRPDLVDGEAIEDDPDRTPGLVLSYTVAETSLNGLTGAPSRATAVAGAELFEAATTALCEVVRAARTEQAPLP